MITDYDKLVKAIISEWRKTGQQDFAFQTRSLERHVIPIIYHYVRKDISKQKLVADEDNFKKKFNQISKGLLHIYWIILWSIKWLLFFKPRDYRFLITAVGSDRKLTFAYLEYLSKYVNEKNIRLLSLTVICNRAFLFRRNIFYFPRFLFQLKFKKSINKFSNNWYAALSVLGNIVKNNIPIKLNLNSIKRFINDYSRDYYCVNYLLDKFRKNIIALIQDFDYTSNRNIYCELFKSQKIPTVALNHSILVYKHLYETVYSDYALVWGQHQKERISELSELSPKNISVIGTPIIFDRKKRMDNTPQYWVYNLSSFENPAAETIHRSVERTLGMIEEISKIIIMDKLNIKLLVNYHPNDSLKALKRAGFNGGSFTLSEILNHTELIFGEDSTVMIEMLKTEIPFIFITDDLKSDPFNFISWGTAELVTSKENLHSAIQNALIQNLNLKKREEHFEYYFGDSENFYNNLERELDSIIE